MSSSLGFLSDDRIGEAQEAARLLMAYRSPNRRLAEPLQTLSKLGMETLHHLDIASATACTRDVTFEVLYRRPDTPSFVQSFVHSMPDIPVLLPLDDDKPSFSRQTTTPFALTRQGPNLLQASHDVQALRQMQMLHSQRTSDVAFVIMPGLFKFAAHWFKNIEGEMDKFQCSITRPGQRSTIRSPHVLTIEGNA